MIMSPLAALRADFDSRSKGSLSMPIAGLLVWLVIAGLGLVLEYKQAIMALVFGTGAIFPIAMLISRWRGEQLLNNDNPLAKLMGTCVVMVNLLWAVHIALLMKAPEFVPLSLGVALGLHWMVYSWIIGHPLGYIHAVVRTLGLLAVFAMGTPRYLVAASAVVVAIAYTITLIQMLMRLPMPERVAAA